MGAVALESFEDLVELEVECGVMGCLAPLVRDVQVRAVPSEDINALPLVIFRTMVRRGLAFSIPRFFPHRRVEIAFFAFGEDFEGLVSA